MLDTCGPHILNIDLTAEKAERVSRPDLAGRLGGVGLATALLDEAVRTDKAVLAPEQPVVLAIGPMTSIYPVVTKVVAMFRSPLTGGLGESHAGMRLGMAMRYAGYDAIVIKGRAKAPIYMVINSKGVTFKPAGPLWGMDTEECGRVLRERETGTGHRSCIRIGGAGEKLIRFSGVNVDTYRHFGRLGLGAVFGSKLLKAVVIQGDRTELPIARPGEYRSAYKDIYQLVTNTELMDKYHGLGTAGNVIALNRIKSLPTRNFQSSTFEGAKDISGEAFADHNLLHKLACAGCPVGCIHLALYRNSFDNSGREYEFCQIAYDHELIYALGSMLGLSDRTEILALIQAVERAGLDAMATGVALAWTTEAQERGLVGEDLVKCRLSFGKQAGYLQAIAELVTQEHQFYRDMAMGTEALATKYGGRDFAMTLGGNEVAGYHTGYGNIVGQALGARHSHLDNAGYSFDQEKEKATAEELAEKLILEEMERNTLTSLCICLFARKVYDFGTVARALKALGLDWDESALRRLGTEIFLQKWAIKRRLGFEPMALRIPQRFFQTPSYNGMLEKGKLQAVMEAYLNKTASLINEMQI